MAKYGISREFEPVTRKGGIFFYLLIFFGVALLILGSLKFFANSNMFAKYIPDEINQQLDAYIDSSSLSPPVETKVQPENSEKSLNDAVEDSAILLDRDDAGVEDASIEPVVPKSEEVVEPKDKLVVIGDMETLSLAGFAVRDTLEINKQVSIKDLLEPYLK